MLWLIKVCCGLSYRVEGMENLPSEPCVVYIKHSSTDMNMDRIVDATDRDNYLTPQESIDMGLIDSVIERK